MSNASDSITGTVVEIIYQNDDNGYTVCDIENTELGLFTATGYMPYINEGEHIRVDGAWFVHPDYGDQFKISTYETILPADEESVLAYLSSGVIEGIREATAKKLVDHFGADVMKIMLTEPERLSEIKGISKNKAIKIGESFAKRQSVQNVVMFLQQYGISANMAIKVHNTLGLGAVELIKANPYVLSDMIDGISFKTADNIAFVRGLPKNSEIRLKSGVKYILKEASFSSGHTYMPRRLLIEHASYSLGVSEDEIENALSSLALDKQLYFDEINDAPSCSLSSMYMAEQYIARRIISMNSTEQKFTMTDKEADLAIKQIENKNGIRLAANQRNAAFAAVQGSVMVLTGGPGTGKTTTIRTIIELLQQMGLTISLAAPTGRAAKRMSQVTGLEAKTIHRLLCVKPDKSFAHDESEPLDEDVFIVDEMSMVDAQLMYSFMKAIKHGARLIMAGDADQLPSVGAGKVLQDIIDSNTIPVIRLDQIFRQAEESLIIVNAHKINNGEMPDITTKNNDFFFLRRQNTDSVCSTIIDLFKNRLPNSYNVNPISHIQVLSPVKKGTCGVINLNKELQAAVNPADMTKPEYKYGNTVFRVGDKVMQTKNNYDIDWIRENGEVGVGIFNGDIGIIESISTRDKSMTIIFDDDKEVTYMFSMLDDLDLAYAITVHKSQGCEFPFVIMPMFPCSQMLMCRNLFYTAVTRARDMVVLTGSEHVIEQMVANNHERERYTGLCEKLRIAHDFANDNSVFDAPVDSGNNIEFEIE